MLVFWNIWFQNYTISRFSIFLFFGITKVANLNVIWMRANNSSHRQLTSCIIRCLIANQAQRREENLLSSASFTCFSIPRLFSPVAFASHALSLFIVIYSLYCFSYSWWCLILFSLSLSVLQKVGLKLVKSRNIIQKISPSLNRASSSC